MTEHNNKLFDKKQKEYKKKLIDLKTDIIIQK